MYKYTLRAIIKESIEPTVAVQKLQDMKDKLTAIDFLSCFDEIKIDENPLLDFKQAMTTILEDDDLSLEEKGRIINYIKNLFIEGATLSYE